MNKEHKIFNSKLPAIMNPDYIGKLLCLLHFIKQPIHIVSMSQNGFGFWGFSEIGKNFSEPDSIRAPRVLLNTSESKPPDPKRVTMKFSSSRK